MISGREQVGVEVEDGEDGGPRAVTENGCDPAAAATRRSPSTNEPRREHVERIGAVGRPRVEVG